MNDFVLRWGFSRAMAEYILKGPRTVVYEGVDLGLEARFELLQIHPRRSFSYSVFAMSSPSSKILRVASWDGERSKIAAKKSLDEDVIVEERYFVIPGSSDCFFESLANELPKIIGSERYVHADEFDAFFRYAGEEGTRIDQVEALWIGPSSDFRLGVRVGDSDLGGFYQVVVNICKKIEVFLESCDSECKPRPFYLFDPKDYEDLLKKKYSCS